MDKIPGLLFLVIVVAPAVSFVLQALTAVVQAGCDIFELSRSGIDSNVKEKNPK